MKCVKQFSDEVFAELEIKGLLVGDPDGVCGRYYCSLINNDETFKFFRRLIDTVPGHLSVSINNNCVLCIKKREMDIRKSYFSVDLNDEWNVFVESFVRHHFIVTSMNLKKVEFKTLAEFRSRNSRYLNRKIDRVMEEFEGENL